MVTLIPWKGWDVEGIKIERIVPNHTPCALNIIPTGTAWYAHWMGNVNQRCNEYSFVADGQFAEETCIELVEQGTIFLVFGGVPADTVMTTSLGSGSCTCFSGFEGPESPSDCHLSQCTEMLDFEQRGHGTWLPMKRQDCWSR
eukprot:scaffold863_cov100-Cylindrotheca_fusiformis.AAC.6